MTETWPVGIVKTSLEDIRVAEVALPSGRTGRGRRDAESAADVGIEDGGEHAGRVEPGEAAPVYGAVDAHESGGRHVANQAVVTNRRRGRAGH